MHDKSFHQDLAWSHRQSEKPFWAEAYKRYFGEQDITTDLVTPIENRPDDGIDKIIHFPNGSQSTVDEKCHRDNGFFKDNYIFLEMAHINSDGSFRKQGWITDTSKKCDYLAYAKQSTEHVFIFPFRELQKIWTFHGSDWQLRYKTTTTNNGFYSTECLLIPADEISEALRKNFVVSVPHKFWGK